jgi:hypothetical protein
VLSGPRPTSTRWRAWGCPVGWARSGRVAAALAGLPPLLRRRAGRLGTAEPLRRRGDFMHPYLDPGRVCLGASLGASQHRSADQHASADGGHGDHDVPLLPSAPVRSVVAQEAWRREVAVVVPGAEQHQLVTRSERTREQSTQELDAPSTSPPFSPPDCHYGCRHRGRAGLDAPGGRSATCSRTLGQTPQISGPQ